MFSTSRRQRAPRPCSRFFGGKITTYRKLAEHALEKLSPFFPQMAGPWTEGAPLPGGALPDADFGRFLAELRRRRPWLPPELALGYARRYGARVDELLGDAASLTDLGRPFGKTLYEREARFSPPRNGRWTPKTFSSVERSTVSI